jgi:signal transduction histidine kinase
MAMMLLVYHFLIWSFFDSNLQPALAFILYGLFLLWQPLWNKHNRVRKLPAVFITVFIASIAYIFPRESLFFFGLILSGLIGSRLLIQTSFRSFDLLALLIIIIEMAVGVVPAAFPQISLPGLFSDYMQTIVLVPILFFFFAPNSEQKLRGQSQVDLMHGLLSAALIAMVLLGGIVINQLYGVDYLDGLLLTVFIVSTLTIGISWFWNPGIGYSGIGVLWNRYAMTIGGPFEVWINTLTILIEDRFLTPMEYLETACENLVENDWLNGIEWRFENNRIDAGKKKGPRMEYDLSPGIRVIIFYKSNPGAALEQHTILLIRMAYQFFLAKQNQEKVRAQEHFATIHHTGARLTHDIKNILQSIKTSLGILGTDSDTVTQQKLLQNNLTQISERLESTLNKLKAPKLDAQANLIDCRKWIDQLELRYRNVKKLQIHRDIEESVSIPTELFDSVVDNLINNALKKESSQHIDVRLHSSKDVILLSVCDDGNAVKTEIEADLFIQPVSSGSGMGIGLYQSAIMAGTFNFQLELSQNEPGKVCFNLFQHLSD